MDALDRESSIVLEPGRNARAHADECMERYASGDDSAFSELYDALAPALYRYLVRQTRDPIRAPRPVFSPCASLALPYQQRRACQQ